MIKSAVKDTNESRNEMVGEGVPFKRIRRITGYLVGDTTRWNNAKLDELSKRVKHTEK